MCYLLGAFLANSLSPFALNGATAPKIVNNIDIAEIVSPNLNYLFDYNGLFNRYFAIRHGQSIANLERIIVSHPDNGVNDFGLSETGQSQVSKAVRQNTCLDANTLIVSSDFKRARESAEIAHRLLAAKLPVCFDSRLRERDFGALELSSDSGYAQIWQADEANADSRIGDAESANQVMSRVSALVMEYEKKLSGATLLLVSHGDALQILQTAFCKLDATKHRRQRHLQTAEIRHLVLVEAKSSSD